MCYLLLESESQHVSRAGFWITTCVTLFCNLQNRTSPEIFWYIYSFFVRITKLLGKKKNKEREREKNEKNAKTQAGDLCDILVEQANVCL